ncbi:MAG TPA: hypothetical protein VF678_07375 [bacterium]
MPDDLHTAARRAELQAAYPALTPAQVDAVLADEATFRKMGEAVSAALKDNGELPFVPLFPERS